MTPRSRRLTLAGLLLGAALTAAGAAPASAVPAVTPASTPERAPSIDIPGLPGMPAIGMGIPHWIEPVHPMVVLKHYTMQANKYAAGSHRGIDIAIIPAEPILAPAAGVVQWIGPTPQGTAVTVLAGTVRYTFVPVAPIPEDVLIVPGAPVLPQEPLALGVGVGHKGCVSCVHFSVRNPDNDYLDPMTFFKTPDTVLMTPRR